MYAHALPFILDMKSEESWSHWYLKIVLKASVNWPLFISMYLYLVLVST